MSYDLVFWRQDVGGTTPPDQIYSALLEGKQVDALADLDLDGLLTSILESFPGSAREPNGAGEWIVWATADDRAGFQVEWSQQHVLVNCRETSGAVMNRLIDIAVAHDCRLYDPQVNERFA
jgi:hypothetical protein